MFCPFVTTSPAELVLCRSSCALYVTDYGKDLFSGCSLKLAAISACNLNENATTASTAQKEIYNLMEIVKNERLGAGGQRGNR